MLWNWSFCVALFIKNSRFGRRLGFSALDEGFFILICCSPHSPRTFPPMVVLRSPFCIIKFYLSTLWGDIPIRIYVLYMFSPKEKRSQLPWPHISSVTVSFSVCFESKTNQYLFQPPQLQFSHEPIQPRFCSALFWNVFHQCWPIANFGVLGLTCEPCSSQLVAEFLERLSFLGSLFLNIFFAEFFIFLTY